MTPRVILLTGAAGGLGRAMAFGLVQAGHLIVMVDRDATMLDQVAREIRSARPDAPVETIVSDLADTTSIPHLWSAARAVFGSVDVLVNNAGLGLDRIRRDFMQRPIPFWEADPDLVRSFFAVNGLSPYLLAREVVGEMMDRSFGRIVNVTTSLDSMIRRGFAPYGGTKASLEAHSAIMAQDLEGTGVTVNVLVPGGPADTAMIPTETGFARERLIQPNVMVPPLLWLISDEAAEVTGHRVVAARWRDQQPGREVLAGASGPIAWPQLGSQTLWPSAQASAE